MKISEIQDWDNIPADEVEGGQFQSDTAMIIKIVKPNGYSQLFSDTQITLKLPFQLTPKQITDALLAKHKFLHCKHKKYNSITRKFESALTRLCATGDPTAGLDSLLKSLEENRAKMGRRTYFYIKKMIRSQVKDFSPPLKHLIIVKKGNEEW